MFFYVERIRRILYELQGYIHSDRRSITQCKMKPGPYKGCDIDFNDSEGWAEFKPGDRWGEIDKTFLFNINVKIPKEFDGKTVAFQVKTGREGGWDALNPQFIIYVNGNFVQGLDVNHREIILSEKAAAGDVYNILLHAYFGMNEGLVELNTEISILNSQVENLYYNLKVPYDVAILLEKEDKRRIDIISFLNETINILDLRKPFSSGFYESIQKANQFMGKEFYGKYCGHEDVIATCVGHTHIDVAWLWTLAQTREKTVRSFSTVLALMEQYPEYIFMSSQPQLYKFIKEDYPQIYNKIKEKIREGRWEPEGTMWVEADCNISSGESLVRQVLFGTRFFEREFGIKNKILWLPDVFGYSAALPQILKKSGIDYFMTTKISWNEYNKIPYDTFTWRGMDGTEILTHFITTRDRNFTLNPHITTYNGNLIPSQIIGAWERYQQKNLNNDVLISFGYGDGGGGPTKEMLENARRMAKGIPGCPKVKIGNSLDYFEKLEKTLAGNKRLPKWVGELYLEYHRGTYTSMARNKKFNRKCEFLYQDAETLSVVSKYAAGGTEYPQEKINKGWEIILLNQFHDILPGSSIKEVYEDSTKQYIAITKDGKNLINNAIGNITSNINLKATSVVVFNQLSFERSDFVEFELPDEYKNVEIIDSCGSILPSQLITKCSGDNTSDGSRILNKVLFFAENVPSKGYKAFEIRPVDDREKALSNCNVYGNSQGKYYNSSTEDIHILSNKYFDIKFDEDYNIISIFDKANCREVIKEGEKANVLQAFEDKPHNYDAWDINIYYQEKMWEVNDIQNAEIVENGPVRTTMKLTRKFLDSIIEQYIYIYNQIPRIDFSTRVDWKEKQILLKAAFPVDVHCDKATFEIQYGNVERPTHQNTSWDLARFETVAHKWVDVSEDEYGVSLLNDSKYGHDIKDNVMRMSLIKSPTYPNVDADREIHKFTYSLYPHAGNWKKANTVQMAYSLNCPMYSIVEGANTGKLPEELSLVKVDKENVVIEVIKKAEDSDDIIVRIYECYNRRTKATLSLFKDISDVWECDLMENNIERVSSAGNKFKFVIKPYEIKTFKIHI